MINDQRDAQILFFVSPDDEHDVLETCRELKIKINTQKGICALRWSLTKNRYMMQGQQNTKYKTTPKFSCHDFERNSPVQCWEKM